MSQFRQASRQAAGLLTGGPVSLGLWAGVVQRCDALLEGRDPAVRHAAAVVPLVLGMLPEPQPRALLLPALGQDAGVAVSGKERRDLRMTALFVTRAVARDAEDPMLRLVLSGVERQLLEERAPASWYEAGLRVWGEAVASSAVSVDPSLALAIAATQRALLRRGDELMASFEVVDGVGHERLWAAVQANRREWDRAYDVWRDLAPHQTGTFTPIGRGTVAVSRAGYGASPEDILRGLLATGFGGSLAAALVVTPAEMRADSTLVTSAAVMETRSDLASTVQPRQQPGEVARPLTAPVSVGRAVGVGPAVEFSAPTPALIPSRVAGSSVADVERPRIEDRVALVGLWRQRVAGVVAEAARAGSPEAQRLLAGVSAGEVEALIQRGLEARGAIATSGLAAVLHWTKKIPPGLPHARDDFEAEASVRVVELVDRWDPQRGTWGSFAFSQVGYLFAEDNRLRLKNREVASDRVGEYSNGVEQTIGSRSPSPEEVVVTAEEQTSVRGLIDGLPPRLRVVAQRRLDLTGTVSTLAAVAAETGSTQSTVHRHEGEMRRILRQRHLDLKGDSPSSVTLRLLAQALRPPPDTVRSKLAARKQRTPGKGAPPPSR